MYLCVYVHTYVYTTAIDTDPLTLPLPHIQVFVRREKPGHIEGNMLRDQIDTLEACINLLALTLDHTYDALKDGDNRAKLSIIPEVLVILVHTHL